MKQIDFDKILTTMILIGLFIVMMIILSPCLLIFTESKDGSITIWNFIGIAYMLGIAWIAGYVIKRGKEAEYRQKTEKINNEAKEIKKTQDALAAKVASMYPYLCGNRKCMNRTEVKVNGTAK